MSTGNLMDDLEQDARLQGLYSDDELLHIVDSVVAKYPPGTFPVERVDAEEG